MALLAAATMPATAREPLPPIIFVHGNGDHAGLWDTTLWRFASNGYDPARLFAVDLPSPLAQASVRIPEENRSSPEDQTAALAAFVTRVLLRTGASKVVLVGSSRGGMTIRNYVRFGGGAAHVSHVITCGTPNHGVFAIAAVQPDNEFNGAGPYLRALNEASEVVRGVRFLTIRSDSNDKFAQTDGRALGMPAMKTNVDAAGPALRGARNVVLAGLDHRETAFAPAAFQAEYEFITGHQPTQLDIVPDSVAVLDGVVSGTANGGPTNVGIARATITVYAVNPATGERTATVHRRVTGADGHWGPFRARPTASYEFEIVGIDSSVVLDVFRSPFPRGSAHVNFRLPAPEVPHGDSTLVMLVRPHGYLGLGRDTVEMDGVPASGLPAGVPTTDQVRVWVNSDAPRSVQWRVNAETIVVRTQPGNPRRVTIAELTNE